MGSRGACIFKHQAYINGKWLNALSGKKFPVSNPANGLKIGEVPDMNKEDTLHAIAAAKESFKEWQNVPAKERSKYLRKWFELIDKSSEDIAKLMTAENGKPLIEAKAEVAYGAGYIEWFAEEAKRIYGEVAPRPSNTREMVFFREPIGVVGLITPWNFPMAMLTRKAAAALAAGCTCVARPAEDTPLTALALAALAEEAGLPKGVFNVVTSSAHHAAEIGKALCESEDVAGISFTGSTAVGKILYQQCAGTVKRLALELGGNAPFMVFDSADIEKAVEGVMASKFRNSGQTCVASNRILVQETVFDEFVNALSKRIEKMLVVGDGLDCGVNQGPLANEKQLVKVESLVKDAVNKGAKVVIGGKQHKLGGLFYEPTVLTNIDEQMECFNEEIFGPVCLCIRFKTEADAIEMANNTRRGLAGYFFSNDYQQIWRVARKLQTGIVGVNEGIISSVEAPFGGIKESGFGREGSHHGIDEYTHVKYVTFGGLNY